MARHAFDLLFAVGMAMATAGLWMFSPAVALVALGIALMGLSLLMARNGRG